MASVGKDTLMKMPGSIPVLTELFKTLEEKGCPYTLDIDDKYFSELAMEPSEHRLQILLWIFSQVHESNEEIINNVHGQKTGSSDPTIDKRVQVLTSLASTVGLCRPVDVDLVRGEASPKRHIAFWRGVTDILKFSRHTELDEIFDNDCHLLDKILAVETDLLRQTFSSAVELLPPNMIEEMKTVSPKKMKLMQKVEMIKSELLELSKQLEVERTHLKKSLKDSMYTDEPDEIVIKSVCCKMELTLADLDQMITTFDQVFINSYLPYCDKKEEDLGELGPLFQIVSKQFSYVIQTFDNLETFMKSNEKLCKYSSIVSSTKHGIKSGMNRLNEAEVILETLTKNMVKDKKLDKTSVGESPLHSLLTDMCSLR